MSPQEQILTNIEGGRMFAALRKAIKSRTTVEVTRLAGSAFAVYGAALVRHRAGVHIYVLPDRDTSKIRQFLVCEGTLARCARTVDLGEYLHLGKGEEQNNGRRRDSILADAFEALLAAVYLDSDKDPATVRDFLFARMKKEIDSCIKSKGGDYKSRLQQLVQQDGSEKLVYETVDEAGPDHAKIFTVEARINSNIVGCGKGHTKREAEQEAAKQALALFGISE